MIYKKLMLATTFLSVLAMQSYGMRNELNKEENVGGLHNMNNPNHTTPEAEAAAEALTPTQAEHSLTEAVELTSDQAPLLPKVANDVLEKQAKYIKVFTTDETLKKLAETVDSSGSNPNFNTEACMLICKPKHCTDKNIGAEYADKCATHCKGNPAPIARCVVPAFMRNCLKKEKVKNKYVFSKSDFYKETKGKEICDKLSLANNALISTIFGLLRASQDNTTLLKNDITKLWVKSATEMLLAADTKMFVETDNYQAIKKAATPHFKEYYP